jgi:hypothetical protein
VRNEAALAELPAPDDEQITGGVNLADPQAARFAGAQPESVAQREDRPVSHAPPRRSRVVGKRASSVEQPAGLGRVEQERDPVRGRTPPAGPQR